MGRLNIVGIAVALLASCSLQTEGLPDLPTSYRAWVNCGQPEPLPHGDTAELPDGWQCMAHDVSKGTASVTCWRGDAEFDIVNACRSTVEHSSVVVGGCTVQIACA